MVLTWELSDGTLVRQNGTVTGNSDCAKALRMDVRLLTAGDYVPSGFGPMPSVEQLDLDEPHLVDSWVRKAAHTYSLRVVTAPEIEYPVIEPEDEPALEPGMALAN